MEKAVDEAASAVPRKTDVIVFIRGGEVWAVNPNNKAERQVTSDGKTKAWPRISPDGKQVVYQVLLGDGSSSGGIFRVSLAQNGGSPEQIHETGDCGAGDIPGTVYIKNGDYENGTASWQIVDIKKKGSNNTELAADARCGKILVLTRSNSKNDGGLVGVEQPLDVELAGLSSLRLRLVAGIDSQALAGINMTAPG